MTALLQHLQQRFQPAQLEAMALDLGIEYTALQSGLDAASAMVLEAIRHQSVSGRMELLKVLGDWPSGPLNLRSGVSGEAEKAAERLLQMLYADSRQASVRVLSAHANVPEHAASALLNLGAMTVGSELQEGLKEQGEGLWEKLSEWSAEWIPALPPNRAADRPLANDDEAKRRWMLPILLLVVMGIGIWYWAKGCSMESSVTADTDSAVIDSAGQSIDDAVQKASAEIDDMQDSVRSGH